MIDSIVCVWCAGTGYKDEFNDTLHEWEEIHCDDCGGTGFDEDDDVEYVLP